MARGKHTNQSDQHVIMKRRSIVSEYRCKGFTLRQIHAALSKRNSEGNLIHFNPTNGKEWSFATIQQDVEWAEEQWRNKVLANTNEIKQRQLIELEMIRSNCWGMKDTKAMRTIIAALGHEAKITGIEAAQVLEHIMKPDEEYQINLLNECLAQDKKSETKKTKKSTD